MAGNPNDVLNQKLISIGFTADDVVQAREASAAQKISFLYALENLNKVASRLLVDTMGAALGCAVVHLEDCDIPQNIADQIPKDLATKMRVIPIERSANNLIVATGNPLSPDLLKAIQLRTNFFTRAVLASEARISEALKKHYAGTLDVSKLDIEDAKLDNDPNARQEIGIDNADDAGITKLANFILQQCLAQGASDIHIEPYETEMRVRLRIDGALQELQKVKLAWKESLLTKMKIMAKMNISEKRLPQDANMNVSIGGRPVDFRVNSCPTAYGEKIVMRILDKGSLQTDMTKLGFEADDLVKFKDCIHQANGMVLVTGPTGSGKTVTLYSALAELNKSTDNIVTAEDPVEFTLPGINQVPIRNDIGLDFKTALKAFLRQDPDIIMVGEIRDLETAEIAMKAALTGHMVLSTLHTNSAPETVTRLLNMGVEPFNLVSALTCVVAQRLVRRVCARCAVPDPEVTPQVLIDIGFHPAYASKVVAMKGKGCATCNNTGEKGRTAIHEVLVMTEEVKQAVAQKFAPMELKQVCMKSGMKTLRQSALLKLARGILSVKEVISMTMPDNDIDRSDQDVA
jgi:type IV pilus assembly protein PilB